MSYASELAETMQVVGMTAAELSRRTGLSKSSISQYLAGAVVPTIESQQKIIHVLSMDAPEPTRKVERLSVEETARLMGTSERVIRKGLQQGLFPWGYAIRGDGDQWIYLINKRRFEEYEKIDD